MADLRYECGCIQRCPSHVTLAPVVPNEVILPQIGQQQLTCGNFDMSSEFRVLLATETNNNTTAQFATKEIHLTTVV